MSNYDPKNLHTGKSLETGIALTGKAVSGKLICPQCKNWSTFRANYDNTKSVCLTCNTGFRPHELKHVQESLQVEIAFRIEASKLLPVTTIKEPKRCILCMGEQFVSHSVNSVFSHWECCNCGLIYQFKPEMSLEDICKSLEEI